MDQLICASLSHTRYWYEVGMLKVPACSHDIFLSGRPRTGSVIAYVSCLRIWSSETGSAVPSRVSLLISILRLNLVLT